MKSLPRDVSCGVYISPFVMDEDDSRLITAINAAGRCIYRRRVLPTQDLEAAVARAYRVLDASEAVPPSPPPTFHSLDAWLDADRRGQLPGPGLQEPSGDRLLGNPRWPKTLQHAAHLRRKRWPRDCDACGAPYTPGVRNTKRCPVCIARAKGPTPPTPSAEEGPC